MGFNEGLTRAALISLWLVLLWLMFNKLWFGCDCISVTLLLSAFPPLKISFRCLLHMRVLTPPDFEALLHFFILLFFLIYSVSACRLGFYLCWMFPGWEDLAWDGASPVPEASFVSWKSPLLDECFRISVQTWDFSERWDTSDPPNFHIWFHTPPPPRWHVFQPWPHSDNVIRSFGCNNKSTLALIGFIQNLY